MKTDGRRVIKLSCSIAVFIIVVLVSVFGVKASSGINANEARVLAVCSSTFSYNGKIYRANSEYIAQVTAYLLRDDIDLTAAQANAAINYIYNNVAKGVSGGYVYEVVSIGEDDKDEFTSEDEPTTREEPDTGEDDTRDTTDITTEEPVDTTEYKLPDDIPVDDQGNIIIEGPPKSDIDLDDNIKKELEDYTGKKSSGLDERPDPESADTNIVYDDDSGDLLIKNGDSYEKLTLSIPSVWAVVVWIITAVLLGVTAAVIIFSGINRCFILNEKTHKGGSKGHRKRRGIRKVCGRILAVVIAIETILLSVAASVYIGVFRDDSIMKSLNQSGYFSYEYVLYQIDEGVEAESTLSYEEFLFKGKKEVSTTIDAFGSTREDREASAGDSLLHVAVADYICSIRESLNNTAGIQTILLLVGLITAIVALILLEGKRYRGVRKLMTGLFISGVIVILVTTILIAFKPYSSMYIEPDYLFIFVKTSVDRMLQVMMIEGIFVTAVSMLLLGVYRTMKNNE